MRPSVWEELWEAKQITASWFLPTRCVDALFFVFHKGCIMYLLIFKITFIASYLFFSYPFLIDSILSCLTETCHLLDLDNTIVRTFFLCTLFILLTTAFPFICLYFYFYLLPEIRPCWQKREDSTLDPGAPDWQFMQLVCRRSCPGLQKIPQTNGTTLQQGNVFRNLLFVDQFK